MKKGIKGAGKLLTKVKLKLDLKVPTEIWSSFRISTPKLQLVVLADKMSVKITATRAFILLLVMSTFMVYSKVTDKPKIPKMMPKDFQFMFDLMLRGFDIRTQSMLYFNHSEKSWKQPIFQKDVQGNTSQDWYTDPFVNVTYPLPAFVKWGNGVNHTGSNTGVINVYPYGDIHDLESLNDPYVTLLRPYQFADQFKITSQKCNVAYEVSTFK